MTVDWQATAEAVVARLDSDAAGGLTAAEARARLARHGPNRLAPAAAVPAWRKFAGQFREPLVLLLIAATAISFALWWYERDATLPYEAIAISLVVLLNAVLGYVQQERAESAIAALGEMAAARATVVRDRQVDSIPAADVVPGDILVVEAGDAVAADARLIHAVGLRVSESALTGESLPAAKDPAVIAGGAAPGDRTNMIHGGTSVVSGRGRAVVVATGMDTEMGRIAGLLSRIESVPTPLQRELDRVGRRLGLVVIVIALLMIGTIVIVEDVHGTAALLDVLILGVALAVAAVPEGLPAVVTAVLSMGVQRMARRQAIVRHLSAVETLGSATVIASDKTGTLTRNEMTVREIVTASGHATVSGSGYGPAGEIEVDGAPAGGPQRLELERTLGAAARANNAAVRHEHGQWLAVGDPTEAALLVAARKAGLEGGARQGPLARVGEVPFSAERKLMSTVHADAAGRVVVSTKGAPDVLLERCTDELVGDQTRPMTAARRQQILGENDRLASRALRTLAVAFRSGDTGAAAPPGDTDVEHGLVFAGLIGMMDPPRDEARASVALARSAGVRPIMITGDHPRTAAVIARELGLASGEHAVTGAELDAMSDAALEQALETASVFARVSPQHKLRIVEALQRCRAIVAMTGDGVNDAPALKAADIGVAMGRSGTDVSREAADMVLADDNFATIVAAVEEGRAIFANIRKFLRYLLSSNIGEVMTMFLGVVVADAAGLRADGGGVVLPLGAAQLLWINLVTDGAPALALGLDPADSGIMRQPPRPPGEPVITGTMWRGILLVGAVMAAGTLAVLDAALPGGLMAGSGTLRHAQTMAFNTLMLFQLFNLFNARSDVESAFTGLFRNGWLWGAIVLSVLLQVLVLDAGLMQQAFATEHLDASDWLECLAVASTVLWIREGDKLIRRRRLRRRLLSQTDGGVLAAPPA